MKRFQVVTHSADIGTDEHMDFDRLAAAVKDAKRYRKQEEYAAVYDKEYKIAYVIFGNPFTPVFREYVKVIPYAQEVTQ